MADDFGPDLDQLLPQRGQRPVFHFLRQGESLLWVTSRLHGHRVDTSALGAEADVIGGKADVEIEGLLSARERTSPSRGRPHIAKRRLRGCSRDTLTGAAGKFTGARRACSPRARRRRGRCPCPSASGLPARPGACAGSARPCQVNRVSQRAGRAEVSPAPNLARSCRPGTGVRVRVEFRLTNMSNLLIRILRDRLSASGLFLTGTAARVSPILSFLYRELTNWPRFPLSER